MIPPFVAGQTRRESMILLAAFVIFVLVTFWSAVHHEAWSDEGDPWLLARDAPFSDMLISAANRGIPLLFDLTMVPFARAGFPYFAMQFVNLVYVWVAILLLFRSPAFPSVVKILFAFSYFPAFEFGVIPRPYGLQMLLMFAIAASWRERHTRPFRVAIPVALLASTTALGLLSAAVAGALLLWERVRLRLLHSRPIVLATGVMVAGGVVSAAHLWPFAGGQDVDAYPSLDTVWFALVNTFFPDGRIEMFLIPAAVVLGIVTFGISRSVVALAFLYLSGAAMMVVYVFVWMGGIRHAGLLLVLVVAAVWVADAYGPYRRERLLMAALAVSFAYSIVPAARAWVLETRYAFSGSREVASFLIDSGLTRDTVLVAQTAFWSSALVYLPGNPVCDPLAGRCRTYSLWRKEQFSTAPRETFLDAAERQYAGRRWVYIAHGEMPEAKQADYKLLFSTKREIWEKRAERYFVYEPR